MHYSDANTQYTPDFSNNYGNSVKLERTIAHTGDIDQLSTKSLSWFYTAVVSLYVVSGGAMIAASIIFGRIVQRHPEQSSLTAALALTFKPVNLNGGILAGAFVVLAAVLAFIGTLGQSARMLKLSFAFIVFSILLTLAFGLNIWFRTMIERREFFILWQMQSAVFTGLLQDRFSCCGYFDFANPMFTTSLACTSIAAAAAKQGCFLPFTTFADTQLRIVFTTLFAIAGLAMVALLTGLILSKRLSEQERFRRIDGKGPDCGLPRYM